ncbi:hypothetical protein [Staphylococcus massiliensis]|nr:hypothetical protein [Staphylococcus massiliensis]MCG3401426.1 hypothetical protein [Staphylococcus massiliensis]MCG3411792.1 hypothetical protein [Staphylococcus massiliensis]
MITGIIEAIKFIVDMVKKFKK